MRYGVKMVSTFKPYPADVFDTRFDAEKYWHRVLGSKDTTCSFDDIHIVPICICGGVDMCFCEEIHSIRYNNNTKKAKKIINKLKDINRDYII
jgi:hypothetical protein